MAASDHIRNPIEWSADQIKNASLAVAHAGQHVRGDEVVRSTALPEVRRITVADLKDVLAKGLDDFMAYRTDVIFVCLIYPIAGLILWRLAFGYEMVPLLFPLASGFALIGPAAAVGLYEISRRHEQGLESTWADAFGVVRSPALGAMIVLALILLGIFLLWLVVANTIYLATLGPEAPASLSSFFHDVFTAREGWALMIIGVGVGFLFALLVLMISVVSFPLLLDRDVGLWTAMATSIRAVVTNPVPMAAWGLIVALGLVLGSIPALLGLIIVLPVLGHATWHLYRKVVVS
ncbi:DUF2189 domain-containing protein [Benzoatithermus flavus]|uniref:DUF2189 domain-containing protein n=1 Tax=Benzoatithermus flavus TaxID=3108223 RepID=A0ABU8XR17_9PROT